MPRRMVVTLVVVLAVILGAQPAAAAAPTGSVRFELAEYWSGEAWLTEWWATGAIEDHGWYTERWLSTQPLGDGVERIRFRTVLHSDRGSIVIRRYEKRHYIDMDVWGHGGWYAVRGTGAYAGITGRGWFSDWNFVFTEWIGANLRGTLGP